MIKFSCHCGNPFEVPSELAATSLQCPKCGLLLDVPTLDDLTHIEADGSFKVVPTDLVAEHDRRAQELRRAFGRTTTTAAGEEIDLRPTMEQVREAGDAHIPIEMRGEVRPGPPRYDPETGELVRPLDVIPPVANLAPVASVHAPSVSYASGDTLSQPIRAILLRMVIPWNAMVVFIIFMTDFLAHFAWASLLILRPFTLVLAAVIAAHYGSIIDEIGRCDANDLPRPLRNLDYHDDLAGPLVQVMMALALCYWPVFLLNSQLASDAWYSTMFFGFGGNPATAPGWASFAATAALFVVGTFLLPATLITTTTSGTIQNLRPDRVLGVIKAAGASYVGAFLTGLLAMGLFAWTIFGPSWLPERLREMTLVARLNSLRSLLPLLLLSAYIGHWFCWQLGLIYREYEMSFPWVLQRHIPTRDRERMGLPDLSPRARAASRRRGGTRQTPPEPSPAETNRRQP